MIAFLDWWFQSCFFCRITYSILAHFYFVYLSLKSPTLISFQLCLRSSMSSLHRYSSYCGSVTIISTQVFFHTVVVLQSIYTGFLPYCGSVSTTHTGENRMLIFTVSDYFWNWIQTLYSRNFTTSFWKLHKEGVKNTDIERVKDSEWKYTKLRFENSCCESGWMTENMSWDNSCRTMGVNSICDMWVILPQITGIIIVGTVFSHDWVLKTMRGSHFGEMLPLTTIGFVTEHYEVKTER